MERKNKAAKAVNIALGLIVILAVVLASPLFGFGRGIASREQRMAAASPVSAGAQTGETAQPNVPATPRPTAQPTPTPVVLPTAPPAPDPTPVPTRRPAAQAPVVQQQVQQPVQQAWPQEQDWQEEEEYVEPEEEDSAAEEGESYGGEELGSQAQDGVIETGSADLVIQIGDSSSDPGYIPTQPTEETQPAEPSEQGGNESEGFIFE